LDADYFVSNHAQMDADNVPQVGKKCTVNYCAACGLHSCNAERQTQDCDVHRLFIA